MTTASTARPTVQVEPVIDEVLRRKMARRGTVFHEQPQSDVVSARLQEFLSRRVAGDVRIADPARLAGGASKEQFIFDLDWEREGRRRQDRMVLRMDPPGSMVETPRLREFEVLQMLDGVVPVPRVYWATGDPAELGAPAMICGYVPGSAGARDAEKTASGLGTVYGAQLREALAPQFVRHLADLHRFDWSAYESLRSSLRGWARRTRSIGDSRRPIARGRRTRSKHIL